MELQIKDLDFGAPAAERDIDHGLINYFVQSEAFSRVASRERTIILGNRGTGKSAIFKVLADEARRNNAIVLELSPEDYSYEILNSALASEDRGSWAKHAAFASAWKYLIWVLVMKQVTRNSSKFKKGPGAKIYNYLRDNHKNISDNPISVLVSYLKRMEGFKIGNYEAGLKTQELAKLYKLEEIVELLPALEELLGRTKVYIFVDELDRGWDASEDAKSFVSGLFQASISINELSPNLTVYVSLRRELYDSIPALYDDAQKYRDIIETLEWSESELRSIIASRIRYSYKELAASDDQECWNQIFAETIQFRKNKSFNYLVDRTLFRPREMIQFCRDIQDFAADEGATPPLDYQTIVNAELRYSEERTKDIVAEYRFQFPGLLSIFEIFRGKVYSMERDELELICLEICTGERRVNDDANWVKNQDHSFLIEVLWRVGFLKAYAVGGVKAQRRSGSSYIGPYQVSHLNLDSISRFQIHPMFRTYLGLKEPRGE